MKNTSIEIIELSNLDSVVGGDRHDPSAPDYQPDFATTWTENLADNALDTVWRANQASAAISNGNIVEGGIQTVATGMNAVHTVFDAVNPFKW